MKKNKIIIIIIILLISAVVGYYIYEEYLSDNITYSSRKKSRKETIKEETNSKVDKEENTSLENHLNQKSKKEKKIEKELEKLGKSFYEDYYYDAVVSQNEREFLSKFSNIGIKVNLDNLSRYNDDGVKEKIKELNNEIECNNKDTKVIIYPKEPYGKKDYLIDVELSCTVD